MAEGVVQAHVDAWRASDAVACDAVFAQRVDQRGFDAEDVFLDVDRQPPQVHQRIGHHLPRAVVGDLAAAVGAHDRDVAGGQQVRVLSGDALCEDRVVFNQPKLVRGVGVARCGESAHGGFNFSVGAAGQ